jgi:hypothetical protein
MKHLQKEQMKKILGGIPLPKNGYCYGFNEYCYRSTGCCRGYYCNIVNTTSGLGRCGTTPTDPLL